MQDPQRVHSKSVIPPRDAITSKRAPGGRSLDRFGTTTGYHLKSLHIDPTRLFQAFPVFNNTAVCTGKPCRTVPGLCAICTSIRYAAALSGPGARPGSCVASLENEPS